MALGIEGVDGFLNGLADRTHGDYNMLRVGRADVVEQLVIGANLFIDLAQIFLDDAGNGFIVLVAGFSCLEEHVGVLSGALQEGAFRIHGVFAEVVDGVHIQHILQVVVIPDFNLLNFVGSTETIKEMQEGNLALNGGQMCRRAQVHNLLNTAGAEHREAGLAAGVNVLMVAEDGQRVGSQGTGGDVEHAGEQLACNLVHIGDHQQQALGSGIGGGQRARGQRTVHRTGRAGLRLHLNYLNGIAEDVFQAVCRPLVGNFRHGGGRCDGVNRRYIRKRVGYMCGGIVTVHGFHFSCHVFSSLWDFSFRTGDIRQREPLPFPAFWERRTKPVP